MLVKAFRSDRGGEFTSKEFNSFCETFGIKHQLTTPQRQQQNAVTERKNRKMTNMARIMLKQKSLPSELWVDVVATIVYVLNWSITSALEKKSQYEPLTGQRPNVDHLKVFSCMCFTLVDQQIQKKMDAKSMKRVFIGYCKESKAYRCLNPVIRRVYVSRDITFFEAKS